jgi:CRISPR/Cas system-associated exonuclease Cas4 (RecB family)
LSNIVPWSFSKIKAFEQCPKQFYHMKVLKEYEDVETEAMRYGTSMHEAAENYVRDKTPLAESFDYVKSALDALIAIKGEKLCEFRMGLTEELEPCM